MVPLLVSCVPLLLGGFFAANNLAGAILGPPAIWERPRNTPSYQDIVGEYQQTARRTDDDTRGNPASLTLLADGTMVVENLPYEFYPNTCTISGTGRWEGPHGDNQQIYLIVTSKEGPGLCASGGYAGLEVTGRSKPYSLYWVIDDPDSGYGVRLSRRK